MITSPASSSLIVATAAGLVARRSERTIDCPVKTIVTAVRGCAERTAIAETISANTAGRQLFMAEILTPFFEHVGVTPGQGFAVVVRRAETNMHALITAAATAILTVQSTPQQFAGTWTAALAGKTY